MITYKDVPEFVNGTVQCEVVAESGVNCQPTILVRYIDGNNYVQIKVSKWDSKFYVLEKINGVTVGSTSVNYAWSFGVVYYIEIIMDGGQITATAYTDVDRSTSVVTVTRTMGQVLPGKIGLVCVGTTTSAMHFDNLRADVTDRDTGTQYYSDVLRDKPIRYWRLGEAPGASVAVEEINGSDGTYRDTPTLGVSTLTSDIDTAMRVRGTTVSNVCEGVVAPNLSAPNDMTVECWYKNTGANEGIVGEMVIMYDNSNGFILSNITATGAVRFDGKTGNGTYIVNQGTIDINDGAIHHIVGIKRNLVAEIWVDGVKDVKTTSNNFAGSTTSTSNSVRIGHHYAETGGFVDLLPMNGVIDEVAIYDYALDPHQVLSHFEVGALVPAYYTAVVADAPAEYWRLGESASPFANEISANTGTSSGLLNFAQTSLIQSDLVNKSVGVTSSSHVNIGTTTVLDI